MPLRPRPRIGSDGPAGVFAVLFSLALRALFGRLIDEELFSSSAGSWSSAPAGGPRICSRREFLDDVPFWLAADLERKLRRFRDCYNEARVHHAPGGVTPSARLSTEDRRRASLAAYRWRPHCRGLFEPPIAA